MGKEGEIIVLSTPTCVVETFIEPDLNANVSASNNDNDVTMEGQAEADTASNLSSFTI